MSCPAGLYDRLFGFGIPEVCLCRLLFYFDYLKGEYDHEYY